MQEPHEQAFPHRRVRFVKLRILENFGGKYTSLGKIKLIEGSAVESESVLREPLSRSYRNRWKPQMSPGTALNRWIDETGVVVEREPNGTPAEANPLELGRTTRGVIDPLGEEDYFKLALPDSATSVLTLSSSVGRTSVPR